MGTRFYKAGDEGNNPFFPCMATIGESQTRIPNTAEIIQQQKDNTITEDTAQKMFFTEEDVSAIFNKFGLGLDSFHLSANRLDDEIIQMNGQMCYRPIFGRKESEMLLEEVERDCQQTLEGIKSLNVENKCEAIVNIIESSIQEDNTLTEIAVTVLVVGVVAFGIGAPFGQDIYHLIKKGLKKLVAKNNDKDDLPPSSGNGTGSKSDLIITPTASEVKDYGTSSYRSLLELYSGNQVTITGEAQAPEMGNAPGLIPQAGFMLANPSSIFGKIPMPSFKPMPARAPMFRPVFRPVAL